MMKIKDKSGYRVGTNPDPTHTRPSLPPLTNVQYLKQEVLELKEAVKRLNARIYILEHRSTGVYKLDTTATAAEMASALSGDKDG